MNYQIAFLITLILLVAGIVFYIFQRKAFDKILFDYKPLKLKYDNLREDFEKLQKKAGIEPEKLDKNGKKSSKKDAKNSPVVNELNDKIRSLKDEISKLKEKNYNLSRDNDSLRSNQKSQAASDENGQREIIELRDEKSILSAAVEKNELRIKELEKQLDEAKKSVSSNKETSDNSAEKLAALERDNKNLLSSLKDVRGELASMKRDYKAEVDNAKKSVKESAASTERALRKDLTTAQNQLLQAKTRADNNHKVYLIARSQLALLEKKIMQIDAAYTPIAPLPVKNDAIDNFVKKVVSSDAREARASQDVLAKERQIRDLEERIQALQNQLSNAKSAENQSSGSENSDSAKNQELVVENTVKTAENALDDLVGSVSELSKNDASLALDNLGGDFADLGLGKMDDDWDSL